MAEKRIIVELEEGWSFMEARVPGGGGRAAALPRALTSRSTEGDLQAQEHPGERGGRGGVHSRGECAPLHVRPEPAVPQPAGDSRRAVLSRVWRLRAVALLAHTRSTHLPGSAMPPVACTSGGPERFGRRRAAALSTPQPYRRPLASLSGRASQLFCAGRGVCAEWWRSARGVRVWAGLGASSSEMPP